MPPDSRPREGWREEGALVLGQMRWGGTLALSPAVPAGEPHTQLQDLSSARAVPASVLLVLHRAHQDHPGLLLNRNW